MHSVAAKCAHSIARVFLPGEIRFVLGGLGAFPQEHRHEIWQHAGRGSASPSPAAESQKDAQHPSPRATLVWLVGQMTETSWPSICEVTSLAAQPPPKRQENSVSQSDPPLVDPAPPLGHFTHSGWNVVITVYHVE